MCQGQKRRSIMPSLLAYWMVLGVVYYCSQSVYTVTVNVRPAVTTATNAAEVILVCKYVLENPDQMTIVKWFKGTEAIISKDSMGKVHGNKDKFRWGEGCSLILLNPELSDSGRYTFTVLAPGDKKSRELVNTELIVTDTTTRETTTSVQLVTSASQSTESNTAPPASPSTESHTASPEDGYISNHSDYLLTVPVINTGVIALVFDVVLGCCFYQHEYTDALTKYRLLLGSLIVLGPSTIGVITGVVGMALRNTIILTVGVDFVCLGVAIHMTKCKYDKQKLPNNDNSIIDRGFYPGHSSSAPYTKHPPPDKKETTILGSEECRPLTSPKVNPFPQGKDT